MIDIKTTSNLIRFSTPINEGSKRKSLLMKEDYITLKFSLKEPIYFKLGDYVDDSRFGLFELCDLQKPSYNENTAGYDYELRLDAYYWKWKNKKFKFTPETGGQEASWNLTASLDVQMGVFLRNLQALDYKYKGIDFDFSIDSTVENSSKLMAYENMNLLDALTKMAEAWDCEWWVTDSVIHFGRCEHSDPVDFELGKNVERMTRSDSRTNFATRVYAFGSTRNIPTNYRPIDESAVVNGVVQKRLMLPVGTPHIDAYPNMSTEEAVEDVVVFDDVFPRRTGFMSNITTKEYTDKIEEEGKEPVYEKWLAYRFKDTGITFSKEYILAGQELKITFQSGTLNGMEFAVTFNPDNKPEKSDDNTWNPDAQVWEIVRNEDYGRELPGDILIPKNGDTYILSGFDTKLVSDTMIPNAEQELKEKAEKYIEKSKVDPSTYDCVMMFDSVKSANGSLRLFEIGDRVNLINAAFFETGNRVSRIIGFEYNLDMPHDLPVYTVGETASYSRISDLEDKIESLTYKGQTYVGNGGSGVYLIRTNDSTPATDSNAFSAKRTLNELEKFNDRFLRKDKKDFAHKHITFEEGITVYELAEMMNLDVKNLATIAKAVVSILRSSKFVDGFSGEGYQIWQDIASGDWNLTIDRVTVRKVMTVYELIVQKIRSVGGMVAVSAANGKVKTVDKIGNQYLFTFEDANQFQPNDLMRCQVFTGKDVKYYWVKVATVSGEYVMVPVSEFAGVVPAVGDECVLMGNTTNKRRQSLIIISATEDGQPRFDCLNGVKTKSFEGCLKVRVGNLDGISDSRFPENMQPSDHGIYGNNCFLTGVFVLSNGKDVMTMFSIMEGMIKSEISSVRNEINEKDNYLSNAAFTKNLTGWTGTSKIRIFSVNGKLLMFNHNFYANKEAFANVISKDNQNVLRLKNSSITQLNADFSKKPVFDDYIQEDAEGNPILDANGNPVKLKRPRMFYVSFRYMVDRPGTLTVHFKGENKAGFEEYTSINYSEYIEAGTEFKVMEIAGKWSGTGDFYLSFSGDMYLFSLALADNRLSDMEEKFTMRFEITDKKIQANLGEINKTGEKLEEYHSEFLLTARKLDLKFTGELSDLDGRLTRHSSRFHVTAEKIEAIVSATNQIDNTIRTAGWITTADGNELWASRTIVNDLGDRLISHEGRFHVTSEKIEAMVSATNQIDNTIRTAGWITTADGNNLWAQKNGIISSINQTAEAIRISASKIELNGDVIAQSIRATGLNINDKFVVDMNGNIAYSGVLDGASGSFTSLYMNHGGYSMVLDNTGMYFRSNGPVTRVGGTLSWQIPYGDKPLLFEVYNGGFGDYIQGNMLMTMKGIPSAADYTYYKDHYKNFIYEDNGYLKIGNIYRGK